MAGLEASWGDLGASWGDLGASWGDLGASWDDLRASWDAIGTILGPLGTRLGFIRGMLGGTLGSAQVQGEVKERSRSAQLERFGTPPLPKLLAKANSDTIMSLLAN